MWECVCGSKNTDDRENCSSCLRSKRSQPSWVLGNEQRWEKPRRVTAVESRIRKLDPHLRRLAADYENLKRVFGGHPYIKVESLGDAPPDKYRVTYRVRGITRLEGRLPLIANVHVVEISLSSEYPRMAPRCEPKTEIFHPNFGSYVCLGDGWSPGEGLSALIIRIGEMIQYRSYNAGNPLNGVAAGWVLENRHRFPIDKKSLVQPG